MAKKERKKICGICGGTGQVSYFKGVSRFLLSSEECGECAGTGLQLDAAPGKAVKGESGKTGKHSVKKSNK